MCNFEERTETYISNNQHEQSGQNTLTFELTLGSRR